jgi:energy-coupling factor transport system permease protein
MLTNITLGQYYPVSSAVHSLDPRTKLTASLLFIISLFWISNFYGYLFAIACLYGIIRVSHVPPRFLLKGLRGILGILIITAVMNVFLTPGETTLWQFYVIRLTREGLLLAFTMALRLVLLLIGSSLLTLTTSPIELTDAIEYLLKPLKKIGVPSHEIAMMMTIALRFIPTLVEEMDKIMKAQTARGADFDTGGLIKKAKSLIPLLVPLFVSSFRRADDLAMAMEARCYRGDVNRTRMKELHLGPGDHKAMGLVCLYIAGIAAIRFL